MCTTVTRRTPTSTSTTCARSEHACTLLDVLSFITHVSHPHWLKSSLESVIPSSRHAYEQLPLILFDFSFYLSPHFTVFFLSFLSMYSDNFDSVTNNLRNSANGTFVTSDDSFPLTAFLGVSVGCVKNKLQFRTVQQNQKSFLWMQD